MNNFSLLADNRLTHLGDAGARLRDAGRRLWPCPQRPGAGAHLYKYNSGTDNWDDYTRLLNRTIAARWRAWFCGDWAFAWPRALAAVAVPRRR